MRDLWNASADQWRWEDFFPNRILSEIIRHTWHTKPGTPLLQGWARFSACQEGVCVCMCPYGWVGWGLWSWVCSLKPSFYFITWSSVLFAWPALSKFFFFQDFEALTPNLLARTVETVEGGGLVVILLRTMNSLKQLYTMTMVGVWFLTELWRVRWSCVFAVGHFLLRIPVAQLQWVVSTGSGLGDFWL